MYCQELKNNPLKSRKDMLKALDTLITPLIPCFSKSNTWVLPGSTGASYTMNGAGLEGFSRPFWGIVPALAGGGGSAVVKEFIDAALTGLRCGTDPDHEDYWGDTFDRDQKFVEMAVLGLSLALCPELFWNPLSERDRENLTRWLESSNHHAYPLSNWLFFRILVNIGLISTGYGGSQSRIEEDLEELETYYRGDGWYADGNSEQFDYYISFGMHFYGMLYAGLRKEEDPERCRIFRERAAHFATDLTGWFASDGSAVAFGRSQTYRFAQCSFWSAAAFCGLHEDAPWLTPGILKGLVLRHMRWWFSQPAFSETGLLSIGYAYPNLNMAEGYNAPGSPYWALKSFLVLALDENSLFWTSCEEGFPMILPDVSIQKYPRMLACRDPMHGDAVLVSGGQFAGFEPRHNEHKYAKFTYSSRFGFSVPTGLKKLEEQGCDNSLMILTREELWLHRGRTVNHQFSDTAVSSDWFPRKGLFIRTMQTWLKGQIIRLHLIQTDEDLEFCEGGYSCPIDDDFQSPTVVTSRPLVYFQGKGLFAGICTLTVDSETEGFLQEDGVLVAAAPNSNLLYPRTVIPSLIRKQKGGTCRIWGTEVSGGVCSYSRDSWTPPENPENLFPSEWLDIRSVPVEP